MDVLERVGIRECVEKLPDGLDTVLSTDGSGFSRGERQLLCISRVILENRKIVILDEASSSMDVATDNRLHELLKTALGDCTVIAIAHRICESFSCISSLADTDSSGSMQQLSLASTTSLYSLQDDSSSMTRRRHFSRMPPRILHDLPKIKESLHRLKDWKEPSARSAHFTPCTCTHLAHVPPQLHRIQIISPSSCSCFK